MTKDLFSGLPSDTLVIGVGSLGVRVAASGALNASSHECSRHTDWSAIHTDAPELIASGIESKITLDLGASAVAAATIRAELQRTLPQLSAMLQSKSTVILLGSLDEPITALLLAQLAARVREAGEGRVTVCCIACESDVADERQELDSQTDLFLRLSSRALTAELQSDCALTEFHALLEQKIVGATETLLGAMSGSDARNSFTPLRLRASLRGSGRIETALGLARGTNALTQALESALSHLSPNDERRGGIAAALMSGVELSMAQAQSLNRKLTKEFGVAPLMGFSPPACAPDEAFCLLMWRPAQSRNVVSIDQHLKIVEASTNY